MVSLNATSVFSKDFENKQDPLVSFLEYWENTVGNYIKGYFLSFGLLLTFCNNFLILSILIFGPEVKKKVSISMRIYYAAIAIGDVSTVLPLHATYLAGKQSK